VSPTLDTTAAGFTGAPVLQTCFDDLYTATYAILDDAKSDHDLVKLYKGSHASPDPHPVVTDFGEYFYRAPLWWIR
jgi:hypothetical protein